MNDRPNAVLLYSTVDSRQISDVTNLDLNLVAEATTDEVTQEVQVGQVVVRLVAVPSVIPVKNDLLPGRQKVSDHITPDEPGTRHHHCHLYSSNWGIRAARSIHPQFTPSIAALRRRLRQRVCEVVRKAVRLQLDVCIEALRSSF